MTVKLGASTIPFRSDPLNGDVLTAFSETGVESLELCDYHPNFSYTDAGFRAFLQQALPDKGLHLNSIHIHLMHRDPACDLASPDPDQRDKAVDEHKRTVDLAAALGGCILVTHDIAIPEPSEEAGAEKRSAFVRSLREVAAYAAPAGIRLALENGGIESYTRDPERLVGLIEDAGAPNAGPVIDTGHRNLTGDPVAALRVVGRHLITLHLHDNHGERDEHLLPGRGNIAWKEVHETLGNVGYDGVFMYEINRPEDVPELRANAAWIRGL